MAYLAEHREVRVTARESVKTPFVAPDMAPVAMIDLELEKGLKGWTDFDCRPEVINPTNADYVKAKSEALASDMTVGTVIRKVTVRREVSRKRPTTRRWK